MYKKECKDSQARVCLSRLTRILDIDMLEDLQQLEHTGNVARNLEIESSLKPQRSFFSKSSEKINKIMSRKGEKLVCVSQCSTNNSLPRKVGVLVPREMERF